MDIAKLKVVELRGELASRGLSTKGNKPVLVERLKEAVEAEKKQLNEGSENKPRDTGEVLDDTAHDDSKSLEPEDTSQSEETSMYHSCDESKEENTVPSDEKDEKSEETEKGDESLEQSSQETPADSREVLLDETSRRDPLDETSTQSCETEVDVNSVQSRETPLDENSLSRDVAVDENSIQSRDAAVDETSVQSGIGYESSGAQQSSNDPLTAQDGGDKPDPSAEPEWRILRDEPFHIDDSNAQDPLDVKIDPSEADSTENVPEPQTDPSTQNTDTPSFVIKMECDGNQLEEQPKVEVEKGEDTQMKVEHIEQGETEQKPQVKEEKPAPEVARGKKRNRWSVAQQIDNSAKRRAFNNPSIVKDTEHKEVKIPKENEPYYDDKEVVLSWYDSDLNLIIDKVNYYSATLNNHEGFGYVWAGVRANYAYDKGKVFYQVKITHLLTVSNKLEQEPVPHGLRVGWSAIYSSLQLGEEPFSYGYGSTGKKSCDSKFEDYGKSFTTNDVIGCYLDLDSNPVTMKFTHNGEDLGEAFTIDPETLKGRPLIPHILSKNCSFQVNFGEQEPWVSSLEGYTFVGKVPLEDRVPGPVKPTSRSECEVIMLVGLPGCGKTTWAKKFMEENKEKMYNLLGTNLLLDKMKVMGIPRRRNYHGRWDHLINKCTRCLNSLLELATQRRRNVIIDQTNVYPSAQRRKLQGFECFKRRAVVIVPTDEELKIRMAKREAEEGKDVPDNAILEMKANFALPSKENFHQIDYVELPEEEAAALVKKYNEEGIAAGFQVQELAQRRRRISHESRNTSEEKDHGPPAKMRRGGYGFGGGGGGFRNDRRGGGNWRDRDNRRDDRSHWQGGGRPSGRGGGNWRNDRADGGWRRDDRNRDRGDRGDKRHSGGNWGGNNQSVWNQQGYNNQWNQWQPQGNNQWKGFQGQQQWGQGWNNPQWANWNQQYFNQGWGQQGWGQGVGVPGAAPDATQVAQQALNYARTGQGQMATQWAGYPAGLGGPVPPQPFKK